MSETVRVRNRRGELIDAPQYTASEAKHRFGQLLDTAVREGAVAITKQRKPMAVILSLDEYRALTRADDDVLAALAAEFDRRYAVMQAPGAADAMQRAFDTSPTQLAAFASASLTPKPARKKPTRRPAGAKRA
ncbi:MAG: type II toxin-antitoxin system Phd/YefM family antitoxin [Burkholderiales bacterium]